uniref:WRKY transcription factor 31 n=1 Tax=Rhizophora mucronata TaxID=61149 RepID=A0A2P2ISP7_RHIMU
MMCLILSRLQMRGPIQDHLKTMASLRWCHMIIRMGKRLVEKEKRAPSQNHKVGTPTRSEN